MLGPMGYVNNRKQVSDTVFFKHKYMTKPSVTPTDAIIIAAVKIALSPPTHMHPSMSKTTMQATQRLEVIFQEAAKENKFANIKITSALPPEQQLQQKLQPLQV